MIISAQAYDIAKAAAEDCRPWWVPRRVTYNVAHTIIRELTRRELLSPDAHSDIE